MSECSRHHIIFGSAPIPQVAPVARRAGFKHHITVKIWRNPAKEAEKQLAKEQLTPISNRHIPRLEIDVSC